VGKGSPEASAPWRIADSALAAISRAVVPRIP
jgi:hypothetical protein